MNGAINAARIPIKVNELVIFFDNFSNFDMNVVSFILVAVFCLRLLTISLEYLFSCRLYVPGEDRTVSPFIKWSITGLINAN